MITKDSVEWVSKVVVTNFPARQELINLLDTFLFEQKFPKDYEIYNKSDVVIIKFNQTNLGYSFCQHLSFTKIVNPLYAQIKSQVSIEPKNKTKKKSNDVKYDETSYTNMIDGKGNQKRQCSQHQGTCELMSKERNTKYVVKNQYHSLCASSNYVDPYDIVREERKKNKERWLVPNNFNASIGKATYAKAGYIPNYAVRAPSDNPNHFPSTLRFGKVGRNNSTGRICLKHHASYD